MLGAGCTAWLTDGLPSPIPPLVGMLDWILKAENDGMGDAETIRKFLKDYWGISVPSTDLDLEELIGFLDTSIGGGRVLRRGNERFDPLTVRLAVLPQSF